MISDSRKNSYFYNHTIPIQTMSFRIVSFICCGLLSFYLGKSQSNFSLVTLNSGSITCSESTVIYYAHGLAAENFTWTGPSFTAFGRAATITSPGNYTVALNYSLSTLTQTFNVGSDNSAPQLSVSASNFTAACGINNAAIVNVGTVSPTSDYNYTLLYQGGGRKVNLATETVFRIQTEGTHTIAATNTITGCSSTETIQVTLAPNTPTFQFLNPGGSVRGCNSLSMNISGVASSGTAQAPYSYTLLTPTSGPVQSNVSLGFVPTFSTNTAGNFSLVLRNSANTCDIYFPFTILQYPLTKTALLAYGTNLTCDQPSTKLVLVSSDPLNASYSINGTFGDTLMYAPITTAIATISSNFINNKTCSSTASIVLIIATSNPPVLPNNIQYQLCASGLTLAPSITGTNTNYSYAWYAPSTTSAIGTASNLPVSFPGTYTLVTSSNVGNCKTTTTYSVNQCDAIAEDVFSSKVRLYYDNSILKIICLEGQFSFAIYDMAGRLSMTGAGDQEVIYQIDTLELGCYQVVIEHQGKISRFKILK